MAKKLIEVKNVVKTFDNQVVLKGISLDIYENEFVTLLGPSGCGKTRSYVLLLVLLNQQKVMSLWMARISLAFLHTSVM